MLLAGGRSLSVPDTAASRIPTKRGCLLSFLVANIWRLAGRFDVFNIVPMKWTLVNRGHLEIS